MDRIKEDLANLEGLIAQYEQKIDEASKKKLDLQTQEAIQKLQETYQITSKFKKIWDSLKSKTITLTVKQDGAVLGGGSGNGGGSGDGGGTEDQGYRRGGIVERLYSSLYKLARGGKLPGYGGGDRKRALLEPGEYVVNKEAVRKIGVSTLDQINSMQIGANNVAGGIQKRLGGLVDKIQRFQSGGLALQPAFASSGKGSGDIHITVAPTYMTGDTGTARRVASDIYRELKKLGVRMGKEIL